jgi:hypothetical protein
VYAGMVHAFLELFETFKCDLELVGSDEGGRVVENLDTEQRDDGHGDRV